MTRRLFNMEGNYIYKVAVTENEFSQIHRLNHDTFTGEIPQHPGNPEGVLIDKFHKENTYFICVRDNVLVGMIAARAERPFSLDSKIPGLDTFLPSHSSACEIRLLAVRRKHRASYILFRLMELVAQFCEEKGHDLLVISGTVRQLKLYKHIGFVPFAAVVGTPSAGYQPMYLKLNDAVFDKYLTRNNQHINPQEKANFLPGPVGMRPEVHEAMATAALSHRSDEFIMLHGTVRRMLCGIVNAAKVELFVGTGTLANDVVAGQLSLHEGKGLILSNGEFGDRLIDHAERFGLRFDTLAISPGLAFDTSVIRKLLSQDRSIRWLWFVHCETSTGILNDLRMMKEIAAEFRLSLCADCISSVGAVKVDLQGVYLASCVSGKCLGAFPGMSMVFYNHTLSKTARKLPRYMDLEYYAGKNGIPFTGSYNLLNALHKALLAFNLDTKIKEAASNSALITRELRSLGFEPAGDAENLIPSVITLDLPKSMPSPLIAAKMGERGVYISYNSEYLRRNNRIQICLMGSVTKHGIAGLLNCFRGLRRQEKTDFAAEDRQT
jgi:aspartate aminotransferase-like enzyme